MKRGLPTIIFQFALSPLLFLLLITNVSAQQKAVETSGDVIYYATPVFCLATTLLKKDYQGTKQLIFSAVTAVGTSYILKHTIHKKRPDGSNLDAVPSCIPLRTCNRHLSRSFFSTTPIWLEIRYSGLSPLHLCCLGTDLLR